MSATEFPITDLASLAPVANWTDTKRSHSVQFYTDDAFLLDALSRFIGTALGAGDGALVIATKAHRDGLAQRLKARGLDISNPIKHGRYIPLDAEETLARFMRDGMPDRDLFFGVMGAIVTRLSAGGAADGGQ